MIKHEIEKMVLSSLLYDSDVFYTCDILTDYFTGINISIFESIKKLMKEKGTADLVSVVSDLSGRVSPSIISGIYDFQISPSFGYHVEQLKMASNLRYYHKTLSSALAMCLNSAELAEIKREVSKVIIESVDDEKQETLSQCTATTCSILEETILGKRSAGMNTGIRYLDKIISGFADQELILIAGRPGTGKTSLLSNIVKRFCFEGIPGDFISLEMSKRQLVQRFLCDIGNINGKLIFQAGPHNFDFNDKVSPQNLIKAIEKNLATIHDWPLEINDNTSMTIDDIYLAAKKSVMKRGIKYLAVDHVGLIKGWNTPGQEQKAEITRMLKVIAKDFNIPVIALSQMNREIEKRAERIPKLSDLRDAGSLEQDADIILFPDVPEREGITSDKEYKTASIYVAKNRRGNTGNVNNLKWQGHYFRYSDEF